MFGRKTINAYLDKVQPIDQRTTRRKQALSKYKLTIEEYYQILESQGFVCAICRQPAGKRQLNVDHNHSTGTVRGLLCHRCNIGVGHFKDSPALLAAAIQYLTK